MKKYTKSISELIMVFIFLVFVYILIFPSGMLAQKIKSAPLYEPENPATLGHIEIDRWSYLSDELQASVGSIDERYNRDKIPLLSTTHTWKGTAWKGEKINLQIVLWTNRGAWQVQVVPSALKNDKNGMIASSKIQTRFVRYVLSDDYFYGCKPNTQQKSPILVADILDNLNSFNIPANTTRPVWVTIDIPADASPGRYQGNIAIKTKGEKEVSLKIQLEVLPLELPPVSEWRFELDLWQTHVFQHVL